MRNLNLSHIKLMGILNLTPDSFFDGGKITSSQTFLAKATKLLKDGATILDIGAEASGPKSSHVSESTELKRLTPYLKQLNSLKNKFDFQISVDTYKGKVAEFALQNGADMINDITAFRQDPHLIKTLSQYQPKVVIMYSKDNSPRTTLTATKYKDVIKTIIIFFEERLEFANKQGLKLSNIILDPGMGAFISTIPDYSYEILERLNELKTYFKLPILISTSNKSMHSFKLQDRKIPTLATSLLAGINGADILRIHDVKDLNLAIKTFSF